jgi:predicted metal-dependent hydrolase
MHPSAPPDYLNGYPAALVAEVRGLIAQQRLAALLLRRYPQAHDVRSDRALYDYVQQIKASHLGNAGPLSLVLYDSRLLLVQQALGMHTRSARVHGAKLKTRREIRIAALFRDMPSAFLRMIVVHELAHLKEREHDKAFYQLCRHIEPDYHQLEFDLRAYLTYLDAAGAPLWSAASVTE